MSRLSWDNEKNGNVLWPILIPISLLQNLRYIFKYMEKWNIFLKLLCEAQRDKYVSPWMVNIGEAVIIVPSQGYFSNNLTVI